MFLLLYLIILYHYMIIANQLSWLWHFGISIKNVLLSCSAILYYLNNSLSSFYFLDCKYYVTRRLKFVRGGGALLEHFMLHVHILRIFLYIILPVINIMFYSCKLILLNRYRSHQMSSWWYRSKYVIRWKNNLRQDVHHTDTQYWQVSCPRRACLFSKQLLKPEHRV